MTTKHPGCTLDEMINEAIGRIKKLEHRLDEMEKNFQGHVLNDKVHIKHKSYRPSTQNRRTSPPPPPPAGGGGGTHIGDEVFDAPPKIQRSSSSPSRVRYLPLPRRPQTPVPDPPPLPPGSAKETKEAGPDNLKF